MFKVLDKVLIESDMLYFMERLFELKKIFENESEETGEVCLFPPIIKAGNQVLHEYRLNEDQKVFDKVIKYLRDNY